MHDRRFNPAQADKLDDPERLKWLPPQELIERLDIHSGYSIADIGAGTGYFTIPFAERVDSTGCVFAVDVAPEMLERIRTKTVEKNVSNVRLAEGEAGATGLADSSCDLVFMANVWHEFDDHQMVLAEARRILNSKGRIAILDWRAELDSPPGPPRHHRISEDFARVQLAGADFAVLSRSAFGQYSWLITASPGQTRGR